jgi:hypothetical protein
MHTTLLAQIKNPVLPKSIGEAAAGTQGEGGKVIGMLVGNIVGGIMIIAFLMALLFIILAGVSWITAGGDKAQLESARNKITNAIIGLIIIAAVWGIMNLLGPFLGLTFPNLTIPTIPST